MSNEVVPQALPVKYRLLKQCVGAIICSQLAGKLIAFIYGNRIPFRGTVIDVSQTHVSSKNKALLFWGLYESAEVRFVDKYTLPDIPAIDLGASLGAISSHIASRLQPGTQLICIEGNPKLNLTLRQNLERNASHLAFEIIQAAIGYGVETVTFALADDNLYSRKTGQRTSVTAEVPAIKLTDAVRKLTSSRYQLISDIEGAELEILRQDLDSLKGCQQIIIELHSVKENGTFVTVEDMLNQLQSCGFEIIDRYGSVAVLRRRA